MHEYSVYQEAIFDAIALTSDPVVVRARAGSGKTTTALEALHEAPSGGKLLTAFNRHIANELRSRTQDDPWIEVKTLHSIGLMTLRHHLGRVEVVPDKGLMIAQQVVDGTKVSLKHRSDLTWQLKQLAGLYKQAQPSSMEEALSMLDDFEVEAVIVSRTQLAALGVKCLKIAAQSPRQVDYDDMIYLPRKLELSPAPYSLVVVDECQDLARGQLWLVLAGAHRVLAIGDERQCQPPGTLVRIPGGRQVPIESLRDGDAVVAWDRHAKALVGHTKPIYRVSISAREYSGPMVHLRTQGRETRCTPDRGDLPSDLQQID